SGVTVLSDAAGRTLGNALVFNGGATFGGSSVGGTTATTTTSSASNLTYTGAVNLVTYSTVAVNNTTTLSGPISGQGGLSVVGSGNLQITGTSNSYLGGTFLDGFATNAGGLLEQWYNQTAATVLTNQINYTATPVLSRIVGSINY